MSNTKITHSFKYDCYDVDYLLNDCLKLSTFMNRLRKQSYEEPNRFDPDVYFGNGFEALGEYFIRTHGLMKEVQIKDYVPVEVSDFGVDGYGYTGSGEIATVQFKARSNSDSILTANRDHISNFVAHSHSKYGGDSKVKHMTLITNAQDLHHAVAESMYAGEVRVIGNRDLRGFLDNNPMFWPGLRDELKCK